MKIIQNGSERSEASRNVLIYTHRPQENIDI